MKHILAAIDFSDVAPSVISNAADLARATSAKLTLLHAATPEPEFVGYDVGPQSVRDARAHELRSEHRDLEQQAKSLAASGIEADSRLVMGPTIDVILGEAQKNGSDLIVIGSHGHSALYKALVGSVAEGVLRDATCPVLVVPGTKEDAS